MFHPAGVVFGDIGRNAERFEKSGQQFVMVQNFEGMPSSGIRQFDIFIRELRHIPEFFQLSDSIHDGGRLDVQCGCDIADTGRSAFSDDHRDALEIILQAHGHGMLAIRRAFRSPWRGFRVRHRVGFGMVGLHGKGD